MKYRLCNISSISDPSLDQTRYIEGWNIYKIYHISQTRNNCVEANSAALDASPCYTYWCRGNPLCTLLHLPFTRSSLRLALLPPPPPPSPPPSRCFTPCTNIWKKLQEMRTICFLSTTRKQPDSIWWFEWVAQVLFACVKERAHALVTLPGSGCGILTVLNPNCL